MAGLLFNVITASDALTATTAKTVIGIQAPANQRVKIYGVWLGFSSVDSTKAPALIEIGKCTFAGSAPPITNCSAATGIVTNGKPETVQTTCGKTWTIEPTVITAMAYVPCPTFMGSAVVFFPFAKEIEIAGGSGAVLRITSPVTCNFTGGFSAEE